MHVQQVASVHAIRHSEAVDLQNKAFVTPVLDGGVVKFTPRPLLRQGKNTVTHWIGGCSDLKAGQDEENLWLLPPFDPGPCSSHHSQYARVDA